MTGNASPEVPKDRRGTGADQQRPVHPGSSIRLRWCNPPHTGGNHSFTEGKPVNGGRQRAALPISQGALVLAGTILGQAIAPVQVVSALLAAAVMVWLRLGRGEG